MTINNFKRILAVGSVFLGLNAFQSASALDEVQKQLVKKYPDIAGTPTDNCSTCHQPAVAGTVNPYGNALLAYGFDFDKVANLDSDKDGVTNAEEILAGTNPGSMAENDTILPDNMGGLFVYRSGLMRELAVKFGHSRHILIHGARHNFSCNNCHESGKFKKWFKDDFTTAGRPILGAQSIGMANGHALCDTCHLNNGTPFAGAPTFTNNQCTGCHTPSNPTQP